MRPSDEGTVAVSLTSWSLVFQVSTVRTTGTWMTIPWPTGSSEISPKLLDTPTSPSSITTQPVAATSATMTRMKSDVERFTAFPP